MPRMMIPLGWQASVVVKVSRENTDPKMLPPTPPWPLPHRACTAMAAACHRPDHPRRIRAGAASLHEAPPPKGIGRF